MKYKDRKIEQQAKVLNKLFTPDTGIKRTILVVVNNDTGEWKNLEDALKSAPSDITPYRWYRELAQTNTLYATDASSLATMARNYPDATEKHTYCSRFLKHYGEKKKWSEIQFMFTR